MTAMRARRATAWLLTSLVGLTLVAVATPQRAFAVAPTFVGGPDIFPAYVASDRTAVAVHYTASGLTPSTTYFVKVRFITGAEPFGSTNRSFTWNPTTTSWIQDRDLWSEFPQVTTDGAGAISTGAGWTFVKFADDTKSGSYRLLISLSTTGTSFSVLNSATRPLVAVLDMKTGGYWIHNGAASGATAAKRAEAVDHATGLTTLALQKTEPNLVDDDADGIVDNEDYGPATVTGDFRFAVPVSQAFDLLLERVAWAPGQNVTGTTADVDIAVGAADTTPPTAPTGLAAAPAPGAIHLSWTAATDDVTGSGALVYRVYRWTDAQPINGATQYTPAPGLLATTTATTYDDGTAAAGTNYRYLVRAVDAATNAGPRSNTATAAPAGATTLTITTIDATIDYGAGVHLSADLASAGTPLTGKDVVVQSSPDGSVWSDGPTVTSATGTYGADIAPVNKTFYRMHFAGDGVNPAATSGTVTVTPRVLLTRPSAPSVAKKGVRFTSSGSLKPHHTAGAHAVKIRCAKRVGTKWVLKKTVAATNVDLSDFTKFRARIALPSPGRWRLQAVAAADALHAATTSGFRYVTVK